MKWLFVGSMLGASAASIASPQSDLMTSLTNLRSAIQNSYDFANSLCGSGKQKACQDAQFDAAQMAIIDAEIALHLLRPSVSNEEAGDRIHRALGELDDAEADLNRAKEALSQ